MAAQSKSEKKEKQIRERESPPGEVIYQAVYREGEHELTRNNTELALSGLSAGLSMGFSLVAEGLLRSRLPDAPWRPLLTKLGYAVGFLIVVLGRQQLFSKTTLTAILPLLRNKKLAMLRNVLRLWAVVLVANLVGAFIFAWLLGHTNFFEENVRQSFMKIAQESVAPAFGTLLLRGILAGWLIALMVWLLPFADSARIWVIIVLAYLVGLAGFPHIIAGNIESFYLVSLGALSWGQCLGGYLLPTLIGNTIGGVAMVGFGVNAEFIEASD